MKKKILCLIMAAVMTVGTAATAYAEDFKSDKDWQVDFDGEIGRASCRERVCAYV